MTDDHTPLEPEPPAQEGPDWNFLLHRNRLAFLWSGSVIAGALSISFSGGFSILRSLLPIGIMIGYTWYGNQVSGKNTQRFADSVYFLGFLWTLWALVDALLLRGTTTDRMFIAFGYALVTTGMGMFLRLFLMQFHYTIPDQLTDARKDIEHDLFAFSSATRENVAQLTGMKNRAGVALDQWTQGLGQMTRSFEVAVQDSYLRVANNTTQELSTLIDNLNTKTRSFYASVESLGEETGAIATQLRSIATKTKNAAEKLDTSLTLVSETLDEFSGRILNIQTPPDLLSKKLDTIVTGVQQQANHLSAGIAKTAATIHDHVPALLQHLQQLPTKEAFDRVFAEHRRVLEDLVLHYAELGKNAQTLHSSVNETLATAKQTQQNIAAANLNSTNYLAATAAAAQDFKQASAKLDQTLTEVVTFIDKRLQDK